jgi:leucyl/phenylalanyl-tRNA--protein transferase
MNRRPTRLPYLLAPDDPYARFPDVSEALTEPDGLLAIGGDLGVNRLVNAYRHGIFPWFSAGDPILWWSPDPRTVLTPKDIRISRSLRKLLRKGLFSVTIDRDFAAVIRGCAEPRADGGGTWLVPEMIDAYIALHAAGVAHSVEVWRDDALVGGLYGVAIGGVFFGESMFSRTDNASKIALVQLCQYLDSRGFELIDCQVLTEHLLSLGAEQIPRRRFSALVAALRDRPLQPGSWDDGERHVPEPTTGARHSSGAAPPVSLPTEDADAR